MNVVREINRINERELDLIASGGASWHDEYKDSAYVFIGGLHFDMTEGDVITMFSQYGEVMDVNLPRDKDNGKTKGFGFLMYEDQRSTVLAVDNLNGAKVLDRVLRVDHVKNYKQPKSKGEDGEWIEPEDQSLNAKPMIAGEDAASESSASSAADIDPDDPMRDYLIAKRKEEKAMKKLKKSKSKGKHKDETPEERRARKEKKKEKKSQKMKGKSEGMRAVEELLADLENRDKGGGRDVRRRTSFSSGGRRSRSRSPEGVREMKSRSREPVARKRSRTPSPREDRYSRTDHSVPLRGDRREYDHRRYDDDADGRDNERDTTSRRYRN